MNHLAIYRNPWYKQILSGEKTMESRWHLHQTIPYRKGKEGDWLYHKLVGNSKITHRSEIIFVRFAWGIQICEDLMTKYQKEICVDAEYIRNNANKPYLSLYTLGNVQALDKPFRFSQHGQQAWLLNFNPI